MDNLPRNKEMIQIAESKKAKDVIENLLRQEDPTHLQIKEL